MFKIILAIHSILFPNVNLSKLKTGKAVAIRFSTLEAICKAQDCQPGDILEYQAEDTDSVF
ncbi:helix-turn-helix domain-containing protein [Enterococcus asini]|uniref:helix-turn-helix domain-containing protein n=1 Tax=Enterococcus asini TaxID=57732 RepID=UPI002892599E|nr:helix-turn-helix domain-containing protein [Enterococcus asini]